MVQDGRFAVGCSADLPACCKFVSCVIRKLPKRAVSCRVSNNLLAQVVDLSAKLEVEPLIFQDIVR